MIVRSSSLSVLCSIETMISLLADEQRGYDRATELKAFDETKSGVKGLVDEGITTIPHIFVQKPAETPDENLTPTRIRIPVIDLEGIQRDPLLRKKITNQVREASERWGFFQVVNHGIPIGVLNEMKEGVKRFYEQDEEVKKKYYTRDITRKLVYSSNFDLYTASVANWRDTFFCYMAPNPPKPEELPEACRDILTEYSNQVIELGCLLFEILSESLGLRSNLLKEMNCAEGLVAICHYYPPCPQPELTMGITKHTDNDFLAVLLQDQIGGLQVRCDDGKWANVPPVPGALVVNIGDLLQLITNDKFKSVEHRVLANQAGPRISVACFFSTSFQPSEKLFGPIRELLSEDNPPLYRETTIADYLAYFKDHGLNETSPLRHFKL